MGSKERAAYLAKITARYASASRSAKGRILDEYCKVCEVHRKHAIRRLGAAHKRAKPTLSESPPRHRKGRTRSYDAATVTGPIKRIWLAADQPCGKRLRALLGDWLEHEEAEHGACTPEDRAKILTISASSLDRMIRPLRAQHPKGLCGTKPGSILRHQIPIRTEFWDVKGPGFMEADTVAHCGNSLAGDFAWSLCMTDIHTTWTECRAVWNKGSKGVIEQIIAIESALPFPLKGFDCDNGSEFLNHHLVKHFTDHPLKPKFTRSRPYKKNDNAHVEQKNWSHVRQLFGYDRYGEQAVVALMNEIYAGPASQLQNFFLPTMKLKAKTREGAKYTRKYDPPVTPYQRVLASDGVTDEKKQSSKPSKQPSIPLPSDAKSRHD